MKKIFIFVFCLFILTGCDLNYNLYIDKNNFSESIDLINLDKDSWDKVYLDTDKTVNELVDQSLKLYENVYLSETDSYVIPTYKAEFTSYYDTKKIKNSKQLGINYSFKDDVSKYYDTKVINMCYDDVNVTNNDHTFSISTSNNFNCFGTYSDLENIKVNISYSWNYKVVSSNADSVKNGIYTWIINKDNAINKPINIELKKVFNWRLMLIIVVPSIIVISIVVFVLRKKILNSNQL